MPKACARRSTQTGSIRGAARLLRVRPIRVPALSRNEVAKFRGAACAGTYRNHKVDAIRELPGDHDVYCLTVPEAGNFALEAGCSSKIAASSST